MKVVLGYRLTLRPAWLTGNLITKSEGSPPSEVFVPFSFRDVGRRVCDRLEPSARALIINWERKKFQARLALGGEALVTPSTICHVPFVCQAVGGRGDREKGERPMGPHCQQGWPIPFFFLSLWAGRCRETEGENKRERGGLAGCGLQDPVSKQEGSSDPSQCHW